MKIILTVTEDDWNNAMHRASQCPIAIALKRRTGHRFSVFPQGGTGPWCARYWADESATAGEVFDHPTEAYRLSERAENLARDFDNFQPWPGGIGNPGIRVGLYKLP